VTTIASFPLPRGEKNSPGSIVTCKGGVRLAALSPALVRILFVLEHCARTGYWASLIGQTPLVITSINDGTHVANSRHYSNEAIDLRSHTFPSERAKREFRASFEYALNLRPGRTLFDPPLFRVMYESAGKANQHFHIQVAKGRRYTGFEDL
jgi:hypothetical protein